MKLSAAKNRNISRLNLSRASTYYTSVKNDNGESLIEARFNNFNKRDSDVYSHGRSFYLSMKRLFDFSLILLFLPVIAVLMMTTAILIKLESKGPILFWQQRVGQNGQSFNMVKFRSMTPDSEDNGSQFALKGDVRITRLGRFIRKMRIDELPQIWNILRGEMSLIGPRPEQTVFVSKFSKTIPGYSRRHAVLPGITGLAQIEQGYVDDIEGTRKKLKYDLHYVDNVSFLMDIRIVIQTLFTMATGFGAR